jgi:hypothetical protein
MRPKRAASVGGRVSPFQLLLGLLLCAGCYSPTAVIPGERFVPPAEWRSWWLEMEACAHRAGAFDAVEWVEAPDLGPQVLGRWTWRHAIYLTPFVLRVNLKATVQHEMLHDLLGVDVPYGAPHPPEFARCGV